MVRRHSRTSFGSLYVYPGGVLEADDALVHERAIGNDAAAAECRMGIENGLDYYSAAIREAFEETGVLFARSADGRWALHDRTADEIKSYRRRLNAGTLPWHRFLADLDLRPDYRALHYIAYWVTPRTQGKRFSTRFFAAVMPSGQHASHDDAELTDSCWKSAEDILSGYRCGAMKLITPTLTVLNDIAEFDSTDAVVAWAKQRAASGIAKILPAFVEVDGKETVVMPDSPHYPRDFPGDSDA